ncbi:unannotated protein [freshwater metagenome]|uniref:Unannotated protein n=1 Tax=freshwater metagenome TaxID=449393 RepID=A0A6J7RQF6_9ZZZZ
MEPLNPFGDELHLGALISPDHQLNRSVVTSQIGWRGRGVKERPLKLEQGLMTGRGVGIWG